MKEHKTQCFTLSLVIALFLTSCEAIACNKSVFEVASYGSNTADLVKLVSDVNKNAGGRIIFPANKTFVLTIGNDFNSGHRLLPQNQARPLSFVGCKYLDIDLNGSTIILDKNHSTKYALFYFYNCRDFSLRNGKIIGDADNHDYSSVIFNGITEKSSHEWGHGVMVIGSRGIISHMNISNMTGDGVYIASYKDAGNIIKAKVDCVDCNISYCRRNGITCASNIGFSLTGSSIHHIGSYGALSGTSPMAGIDFEYEDGAGCQGKVFISGCSITDCEKKTISASNVYPPVVSTFQIDNSTLSGSSFQIANLISKREKKVQNCSFREAPINCGNATIEGCKFVMGPKLYYVHGTSFANCTFEGSIDNLNGPYGCAIVGNSLDMAIFNNCIFRNIRGLNNTSAAYQGISGYNFPLVASFSKCTFYNTSFVKGNPKHESSFYFDKCTLYEGCMIYNEGGRAIKFVNSKVYNVGSYPTQNGEFTFEDCEIVQDDENVSNPLLYFGTHTINKSKVKNTLKITPLMKAKGVHGIKYKTYE